MKIIVTGCAGMIGSNLCQSLLDTYSDPSDHTIIGIDDFSRGTLANLKEACGHSFERLTLIEKDLSIYSSSWASCFENADIIIHLADIVAGIGYVFSHESYVFRKNLQINSNVTEAISTYRPKRYIYVGTACSFPRHLQLSIDSRPLVEADQFPASPESGYGWSKLMGEIEASYLSKEKICDTVVLSLHNVYGKYCDISTRTSQVIPSLCRKAIELSPSQKLEIWGDGTQGRAFVHTSDVVTAILQSFQLGHNVGPIQIGPDICTSINTLARVIVKALGLTSELSYRIDMPSGDIGRCANYSKAYEVLGWQPKVSIDDGIADLLPWIKRKLTKSHA